MLVIIGARWRADIEDRLPDADDMVRYEVAAGLKRKLRIIPVLIDGARMVGPGELPAELSQLASINAVEVRHSRFDDDVGNLVRAISGHAHLRAYSAGPSYLRIAASALGGALGGIVMIIACLVLQHMITGHALSEHIGADGATLVFAFGPTAGAIAGYALAKQRTWRLRLGMGE